MGNLFKRKKGEVESPIWQMRYRVWDVERSDWGSYKYESTDTVNRREAEALLLERERREERRKVGLEKTVSSVSVGRALTMFLDETQVFDRVVPERNRKALHPVLGREVEGTAWWARTVEFAADALRFFGDGELSTLAEAGKVASFARWLADHGGAKGKGVGSSTRHKVLTWLRRFTRWAVARHLLATDPCESLEVPREVVERRDRIIDPVEEGRFWGEYEALPLKAKARVGLALATGARAGEIDTIRVSDVAPEFGTVRRRLWKKSRGDAPKEAVVKVPSNLMALLVSWITEAKLEAGDRLFPVRCQAGVKFLRRWRTSMRGMRRTVLTRLHDAGVPLRVIQEAAGHAKLDTTQRYISVGETAVNRALSSLSWGGEGAIKSAINPPHQTTTDRGLTRQDGEETMLSEADRPRASQ